MRLSGLDGRIHFALLPRGPTTFCHFLDLQAQVPDNSASKQGEHEVLMLAVIGNVVVGVLAISLFTATLRLSR
jgi:hypothetical protein